MSACKIGTSAGTAFRREKSTRSSQIAASCWGQVGRSAITRTGKPARKYEPRLPPIMELRPDATTVGVVLHLAGRLEAKYPGCCMTQGPTGKGEDEHGHASAAASIHPRNCRAESPPCRGRMEFSRSRKGVLGLHPGFALAQSIGIYSWPGRDCRVSPSQMGLGTRLPPDQGTLGVCGKSYCSALRL